MYIFLPKIVCSETRADGLYCCSGNDPRSAVLKLCREAAGDHDVSRIEVAVYRANAEITEVPEEATWIAEYIYFPEEDNWADVGWEVIGEDGLHLWTSSQQCVEK